MWPQSTGMTFPVFSGCTEVGAKDQGTASARLHCPRVAQSTEGSWCVMQNTLGAMEHHAHVQRWLMNKVPVGTRSKSQEKLWNI